MDLIRKVAQWISMPLVCFTNLELTAQSFSDSSLPIVIINTDGSAGIQDDSKIWADMVLINRQDGERNNLDDQTNEEHLDFSGRIKIETRGSSSQALEKKQYALTTYHDDQESKDEVRLLDMAKDNDWILGGLAFDSSMVRDYLSYNLSRQIGQYAPRLKFCELVLNGDYRGLYLLIEKIKAHDDKIDINKIDENDLALPNLSGGYITKADKVDDSDPSAWTMFSHIGSGVDFIHVVPKPDEVLSQQNDYIRAVFESLETKVSTGDESLENGYPAIIDIPSFIDFMLLNELSANVDGYQFSTYFHKDRNAKLRAGPIWDFNLTYGNDLGNMWGFLFDRSHTDTWQFDNGDNVGARFWYDLYHNDTYRCYLARRWNELIQAGQPFSSVSIGAFLDETVAEIEEAILRENERWGTTLNHSSEIQFIKDFIAERTVWMTNQLGSFEACSNIETPPLVITKINYHPADNQVDSKDQEFIEITNNGNEIVDLTGIYFGGTGLVYQFLAGSSIGPNESLQLANHSETYELKYGEPPFDEFNRSLSNGGQTITLLDGFGNVIDEVTYDDESPWPDADGNGFFLELNDPDTDNNDPLNWKATKDIEFTFVTEVSTEFSGSLYPNPTNKLINIAVPETISSLEVMTIEGQLVLSKENPKSNFSLDVSNLQHGIYILQINTRDGTIIRKFVKKLTCLKT